MFFFFGTISHPKLISRVISGFEIPSAKEHRAVGMWLGIGATTWLWPVLLSAVVSTVASGFVPARPFAWLHHGSVGHSFKSALAQAHSGAAPLAGRLHTRRTDPVGTRGILILPQHNHDIEGLHPHRGREEQVDSFYDGLVERASIVLDAVALQQPITLATCARTRVLTSALAWVGAVWWRLSSLCKTIILVSQSLSLAFAIGLPMDERGRRAAILQARRNKWRRRAQEHGERLSKMQ